MRSVKVERIDSEIARELSLLIAYEVKDPRIADAMITVTGVKTTKDLKYAKVFVSIMAEDKKSALKLLQSMAGFLRSELSARIRARTVPELTFALDESFEYGQKIEKILRDINASKKDEQ
ncbi:MAG TPA: 30S ribosome-binding factor RbfA [Clostridia bacterium]|jgi:ribosome-binding factor A|nr:30S ribosome-binding factor RbfA [Clostridia bacterium]HOK81492.1 30S ribosome-binding factor RbfA [Clostridia bacterium]HOL60938.1 30S ribosome-binding factor RbfA [Clostridia bacterium]HPO53470.1 30S ribosome-binding factor RbfA [Clostridia bacterium]